MSESRGALAMRHRFPVWLAREFARRITAQLSAADLEEVRRRNRWYNGRGDSWTCASTEVCDANEIMAEAWLETFGTPVERDAYGIVQHLQDGEVWDRAWALARAAEFKAEEVGR